MNKFFGLGLLVALAIISSTSAADTCKYCFSISPYYKNSQVICYYIV